MFLVIAIGVTLALAGALLLFIADAIGQVDWLTEVGAFALIGGSAVAVIGLVVLALHALWSAALV